jgi:hypothetical protein
MQAKASPASLPALSASQRARRRRMGLRDYVFELIGVVAASFAAVLSTAFSLMRDARRREQHHGEDGETDLDFKACFSL